MKTLNGIAAGFAGAVVLTITHQVLHHVFEDAPRMDLMGEEALTKLSAKAKIAVPQKNLYDITMAGDIVGNSMYYALAAAGDKKNATMRGITLGFAAGVGGVLLPKKVGLTNSYSNRNYKTILITIGIYTLGGFVSGKITSVLGR